MRLNLPILERLQDADRILVAGAGGGYDIYAGLPLAFTLREAGKTVHLANYSFSDALIARLAAPLEAVIPDVVAGRTD